MVKLTKSQESVLKYMAVADLELSKGVSGQVYATKMDATRQWWWIYWKTKTETLKSQKFRKVLFLLS